ncbi:MAG: hypothetical protein ITG01_06530 [Comamonas sp.]|nr:hypothetical protein [Comamonas sp.]
MHFEFADSEVAQCVWEQGQLQLRFSAAQLIDTASQERVWAPLLLTAEHVEPWDSLEALSCMGRLRQGVVLHASQRLQRLPAPCELLGVVTLELEFEQGGVLRMRCEGLALHPLQTRPVGAYQC